MDRDMIRYHIMGAIEAACACGFFAVCLLLWVGTP